MTNEKNNKNNIVRFPNLNGRLLEKGMDSLKSKKYDESLSCFEQLLYADPMHAQGNLGLVLSLVELGRLHEAKQRCDRMLKEGIGEYYDVLQIYLSILVQLSEYITVVSVIEAVLEEQKIPADKAETFYQLLQFSRKVIEQEGVPEVKKDPELPTAPPANPDFQVLKEMLASDQADSQWMAVQQLKRLGPDMIVPMFESFLIDEKKHPAVKSLILQYLKENQVDKIVRIEKYGQFTEVDIAKLTDLNDHFFYKEVKSLIKDELEQENPSLLEIALAVWKDYSLALYPFSPTPENKVLWFEAAVMAANILCGMEEETDQEDEELQRAVKLLVELERFYMQT
jgi:tetratricopeptide (TPR) repeat protein